MSSKRKGSPDVCVHDILAQFLSKELKDKCLSENEQTEEEEMSETLCSSDDETAVRNMKSKKKKKHKKHKSKKKKHDSGKEKNRSKKRRYQNYDSENEKRKVSKTSDMPRPKTRPKEEVLKQDDRNTSPEIKSQAVLKSCVSNISENSEPKDDDKCKNETEITSIQFPVTKMNFIEDVDCLDSVKNLVKLPKNCEVVLGSSVHSENELIEKLQNDEGTLRRKRKMDNSALESKEEVCSHTKMTAFVTLQGEDNSAYNKIKEGKLDIIKTINSLNDKDSDDCVKLKQNDEKKQNIFNSLKYDDNKNVHQETISSMGTKNVISQQVTSKCQSNRDSDTTVHKVPTSFCTRDILLEKDGEERTVAGHFSIGSDKNLNEICLRPEDHKNSLNTKETGEISHESKRTCNEKEISLRKNSNKIKQECVRKPESVGENVNAKSVQQYTETNSNSSNSPDISVGEIENSDKEITLMNQFASFAPKIVDKPEPTEDKDCELNTLLPQSVNTGDSTVSSKKNFLSKSKILIKDLKCSLALQKAAENSQKKAELLEEGEITTSSGEEVKGDGEKSLESLGELNSDEGSGEVSTSDEERKHKKKKKKKHKHKKKKKRATSREKIRNRHCRKSWSPSPSSYSRRNSSRFSTEENRKFDSRNMSPSRNEKVFDLREKIDKARLLEVARQNVLKMIETGTLPKYIPVDRLKHEQLVAIKAGGKSVAELTEFCKNLAHNENTEMSSSEEEIRCQIVDAVEEDKDTPFIRHPFKLKDTIPSIKLNIRNAVQVPVKTPAERVEESARLRQQFPVSSGNVHRMKELEWVPVDKDDKIKSQQSKVASKPTTVTATTTTVPEVALELPTADSQSVVPIMPVIKSPCHIPVIRTPVQNVIVDNFNYGLLQPQQTSVPAVEKTVFPQTDQTFDVSDIMAQRLHAVRKLQENPDDTVALKMMSRAQLQMQAWVHSKQLPGQFTGSTDARILSPEELSGPYQAWARKDQLSKATPVKEGIGMHLLKKMGWNPGEGLGKNKEGSLEPLLLNVKTDKKGLVAGSEMKKKPIFTAIAKDFSGKHPVSAIMELCTKRRWDPPQFSLVDENGPSHKKTFLFKVRVNGIEYQPAVSSPSKKQAKAVTATVCLQALGILPRDLDNSL